MNDLLSAVALGLVGRTSGKPSITLDTFGHTTHHFIQEISNLKSLRRLYRQLVLQFDVLLFVLWGVVNCQGSFVGRRSE